MPLQEFDRSENLGLHGLLLLREIYEGRKSENTKVQKKPITKRMTCCKNLRNYTEGFKQSKHTVHKRAFSSQREELYVPTGQK